MKFLFATFALVLLLAAPGQAQQVNEREVDRLEAMLHQIVFSGLSQIKVFSPTRPITPFQVYQAYPDNVNWDKGHSVLFIGSRTDVTNPSNFLKHLSRHVEQVRSAFRRYGLQGYVLMA